MGDLGVIGVQPDFALGNDIGRNKLNFGYGVNFKYNGEIHNNLDRVWVVQRFNLPKGLTSYFTGMKFGLNCEYSSLRPQYADKAGAFDSLSTSLKMCAGKLDQCWHNWKKGHTFIRRQLKD